MITKGMTADGQELEAAVAYLGRYLNRLNINTAPASDIADILGLPKAQSEALAAHRLKHGEFKNFDSLGQVSGIDLAALKQNRDRIAFTGTP
jgi:competence ComEA-like helix-hairpin-helix protein